MYIVTLGFKPIPLYLIRILKNNHSSGGSMISRRGGVDSRGSYVSKILYVETKESGPLGGRAPDTP